MNLRLPTRSEFRARTLLTLLAGLGIAGSANAGDLWELRGFVEPEARAYVGLDKPRFTDSSRPDLGFELRLFPTDEVDAAVIGDVDLRYVDVDRFETRFDLREAFVRFYRGPLTLTLGKQLHTWGTVTEFGVVDILNPQELPDLAQNLSDRKLGMWTLKAAWDFGPVVAEAYVMPFFRPADIPLDSVFVGDGLPRAVRRAIEADAARGTQAAIAAQNRIDEGEAAVLGGYQQLQDGYRQIDDARAAIAAGQAQLETNRAQLEAALAAAQAMPPGSARDAQMAEIHAGLAAISEQGSLLGSQLSALERQQSELDRNWDRLDANATELEQARVRLQTEQTAGERRFREALQAPTRVAPSPEPRNVNAGLRLYAPLAIGDFSLGVARLHDQIGTLRYEPGPNPGDTPSLLLTHPEFWAYTFEASIPISVLSLRLEALYLDTSDRHGTDPFVRNPSLQTAAQLAVRISPEWQLRAGVNDEQIFAINDPVEKADEYSIPAPAGSALLMLDPRIAHLVGTWRYRGRMDQVSVGYLWAWENDGHFLTADVDWGLVDGLRLRTGAQYFAGPRDRSFGSLGKYDNVYVALRMVF